VAGKLWTSDQLISSVRQRCYNVASSDDFTDPDLLQLLNENVDEYLVPFVIRGRRNHFVRSSTTVLPQNGRARMPSGCTTSTLRAAVINVGGIGYPFGETDLEYGILASNSSANTFLAGVRFYFEGDYMVFVPPQSIPAGSPLTLYFYARPPLLVKTADSFQVTSFPGGAAGGFYRVAGTVPSNMSAGSQVLDVTGGDSSFQRYQEAVTGTVGAGFIDLPVDTTTLVQPAELKVGDWVNLTGQAPVVTGCPAEFTLLLCQVTAVRVLEAKGYEKKLQMAQVALQRMEASANTGLRRRNVGDRPALEAYPERVGVHPFYLV